MRRADMAVYAAKRAGRNRVVVATADDAACGRGRRNRRRDLTAASAQRIEAATAMWRSGGRVTWIERRSAPTTPARPRSPGTGTSSRRRSICTPWSNASSARRPHRRHRLRQRPRGGLPRRRRLRRDRLRRLRRAARTGAGALSEAHIRRPPCCRSSAGVPDAAFDNVLCETVIMHLRRPQILAAVRRLLAILKPDGILYLSWRVTDGADQRDRARPALLGLRERAGPRGARWRGDGAARRRAGQRILGQDNSSHRGAPELTHGPVGSARDALSILLRQR